MSADAFHPYIARDRVLEPYTFDFHIEDETARLWYDGSPSQWMPERQWCLEHIREGFNILDCGAHHGMMAVLFAKKTGAAGKVIAWEALPSNAVVIQKNVALNGLTNVIVRPFGIGAQRASLAFDRNAGNVVVKKEDAGVEPGAKETIEIVALDDDIDPKMHVDFMKIDVEGSDLDALKGARRVLSQRPIIDLEIHNFLFGDREGTLREIFAILDGYGYAYEVLPEVFSDIVKIEGTIDLAWLAQHDNPHVFCIPPHRIKGMLSGIREKARKLVKGLRPH